jgi:TolB-like protein/DNA-binding winged helix-turn-helix (wHTH) protein
VKELAPSHGVIRFNAFEVDFRNGEVRKHGFKIRLQDQPFHVLQILLEHPGELVTREELQRQIWPADTFVDFEKGLNNAIKRLRDALGDSAEQPRFIETHSRRGYRFIGSVTPTNGARRAEEGASTGEVGVPVPSRPFYRRLAIGVVLFLAFVATLFGLDVGGVRQRWVIRASSPVIHSLAVLPLANLSNDPNQEYLSDGMTDALITDLAQVVSLKVISRTSSMQYKQTKKSLPEIARELNVDGIVEGTVQRSGDRVRITTQLIHGLSDKHLWAKSYERDLREVFALQRDVAEDVANQVQARLMTRKQGLPSPSTPRLVDPQVLDAYIQGSYHLYGRGRGGGDEEEKKAQAYFQHAIDLDSNFAPAYVGVAQAYAYLSRVDPEDSVIWRRAAEKAVELDPSSSDAMLTVGDTKDQAWDWHGAEEDYRRALALNPNNAAAHNALGRIYDELGRLEEGWKEFQIAQELDPNQDHLADPLYIRSQFDRAIEIRRRFALRDPGWGYNYYALAMNYAQKGMFKEFAVEMGKAASLYGMPEVAGRLQHAYDQSGGQGVLRQWAEDLEHFAANKEIYMPGDLAELNAALGDRDRAFYWLEEYRQHHDLATAEPSPACDFKTNPWFAPLRSDPRFSEFLRRAGLPP